MKKRRKGTRGFESPAAVAEELRLFIDNDGALYRSMKMPILKNQCAKKKRGAWNSKLAAKGWMHLVEAGAKKYAKEFSAPGTPWHAMFPMKIRRAVAHEYAQETANECTEHGLDGLRRRR
jgi:hypothetical protein